MTYMRDAVLFCLGVALILKQSGIGFPPPEGGPQVELLFVGALFCNGPLFLAYLQARRGTSTPSPEVESVPSASPSAPQSDPLPGS